MTDRASGSGRAAEPVEAAARSGDFSPPRPWCRACGGMGVCPPGPEHGQTCEPCGGTGTDRGAA